MTSSDYWYRKWIDDGISDACIARVTRKCDQECEHCAFRSSPSHKKSMSPETCSQLNAWLPHRAVLNIMGGEFTVLDNYEEIVVNLSRGRKIVRMVTNGSWGNTESGTKKFVLAMKEVTKVCGQVDMAVSNDRWHQSPSSKAIQLLQEIDLGVSLVLGRSWTAEDLAPIGRAWDNKLATTVDDRSCECMCNMMVTEDGVLSRCPYGYFPWKHFSETTWQDAKEYILGWRSEKLSEGMNCHLCMKTDRVARGFKVGR